MTEIYARFGNRHGKILSRYRHLEFRFTKNFTTDAIQKSCATIEMKIFVNERFCENKKISFTFYYNYR